MILSARRIKRPRKIRICSECERPIMAQQIRLYGMAHYYEKPQSIYFHPECVVTDTIASASVDPKIKAVLGGEV